MRDLRVLVFDFARSYKYNLIDPKPEDLDGVCSEVSGDLIDYLEKNGIICYNIFGLHWKLPFEKDCLKSISLGYVGFHMAVLVEETIIDLTGIQFGKKYKDNFYPKEEFYRRFKNVYENLTEEEMEEVLGDFY